MFEMGLPYTEEDAVLIGLSGGINSMAVLCWLIEQPVRPKTVHLFYAHFDEHSPDTFQFVADGIRLARKCFDDVRVKITHNSILKFFEQKKFIPHPYNSYCTMELKIKPINDYAFINDIKIDLVGYVVNELKRRVSNQQNSVQADLFSLRKYYPIGEETDEWCFHKVMQYIGWYPEIYDITWTEQDFIDGLCDKRDIDRRVFKHNNCLPCKNMYPKNLKAVKKHYPDKHAKAMRLSALISRFWGRDEAEFYATFGRELGQDESCEYCKN